VCWIFRSLSFTRAITAQLSHRRSIQISLRITRKKIATYLQSHWNIDSLLKWQLSGFWVFMLKYLQWINIYLTQMSLVIFQRAYTTNICASGRHEIYLGKDKTQKLVKFLQLYAKKSEWLDRKANRKKLKREKKKNISGFALSLF
jgi:hypothetical protein